MAHLLMIQCNRLVAGVQYPGISSIHSFLKKKGHEFTLFDVAEYTPSFVFAEKNKSDSNKEPVSLQHKHVEEDRKFPEKKSLVHLVEDLLYTIEKESPDIIGFSCFSDDWPFAYFLIRQIHSQHNEIPIIVGGVHATVHPAQVIMHPQVKGICIGEGEGPLTDLLNSLDQGHINTRIPNFWFRENGKIIKNDMRSVLDFNDEHPFLDWDIYSDIRFVYPYEGKLYRRGSVFLGRGCPYSCTFCVNSYFRKQVNKKGCSVRIKSAEFAIAELEHLKSRHHLEFLRFWDETFLSMPMTYLNTFARRYSKKIDLPFTIETTANSVNADKLRILADMGCQSISMGVETSNEKIRKEILKKNISNTQFFEAFRLMGKYGLRRGANFMFFLPHSTIRDMYQDICLSREWEIESPSPRIFYPYRGTELRDYCLDEKMINLALIKKIENENAIESLENLSDSWVSYQDSVLNFKGKDKKLCKLLMENFILFQEVPEWLHEWLYRLILKKDVKSTKILNDIKTAAYHKRFENTGEVPNWLF